METFASLYTGIPIIVTSRKVGYEQAPLDSRVFEVFSLAPLSHAQVEDYVTKWFTIDIDLTAEEQERKVKSFLAESVIVPDLRSNPLMLALMCNIYRGENYIPKNRPEVYEKCAVMLFERWDKSRGLKIDLPFEAHIRPTMMFLAHWIYSDEGLQAGITERILIRKAADYLMPRRFEDRDEAENAARDFIEFCRGRAWVFTDTGTTKEGESLYQFTHRTFLEYFTSSHLVRSHATPTSLFNALLPKVSKREWDVVALLSHQIQDRNLEGAGDELLTMFLEEAEGAESEERFYLLSFAARCLEFLVPSPQVVRQIAESCVSFCIEWGISNEPADELTTGIPERDFRDESLAELLLYDLLGASDENIKPLSDAVKSSVIANIRSNQQSVSKIALEIGLHLDLADRSSRLGGVTQDVDRQEYWQRLSDEIYVDCSAQAKELSRISIRASVDTFMYGEIELKEIFTQHGFEALIEDVGYITYANTFTIPVISIVFFFALDPSHRRPDIIESIDINLRQVPALILDNLAALDSTGQRLSEWFLAMLGRESDVTSRYPAASKLYSQLDAEARFGALLILALLFESAERKNQETVKEVTQKIDSLRLPLFEEFGSLMKARCDQNDLDSRAVGEALNVLPAERRDLMQEWVQKKFHLFPKSRSHDAQQDP